MNEIYLNRHFVSAQDFHIWAERAGTPWVPAAAGHHLRHFSRAAGPMLCAETDGAKGHGVEILSWSSTPTTDAREVPLAALKGRLRFRLRCQPTRRRGNKERDVYALRRQEDVSRADIYSAWLGERLKGARINALEILRAGPERIELPGKAPFQKPVAHLSGEIQVDDPRLFAETLLKGIGRQVSLGFGMMLVGRA